MNILFFLTPKSDVAYVEEDDSLRQVLEKMEHHGMRLFPCFPPREDISEPLRKEMCSGS